MKLRATSARRYAQALLAIALERGTADDWLAQVRAVAAVMEDSTAARLVTSPIASLETKARAVAVVAGPLSPEIETLVRMLLVRKRLQLVPTLAEAFADLIREHRRILRAEVITAIPLSDEHRVLLTDRLSRHLGKDVEIDSRVDPAIIGGVVARIGDRLLDGSVAGRLQRLRERLRTRTGG